MESKLLVVLLWAAIIAVCRAVKEVNLGSSSTICGTKMEVPKEEELRVYSNGGAPRGMCSIVLNAQDDTTPQCPYRAFCILIVNKKMNSCASKVILTGTSYKGAGLNTREVSCYSSMYGAWCSQSRSLQILVLEDPKSTSPYSFNMTVQSECRDTPSAEHVENYFNAKKIEDIEQEIHENRIVGVIVGLSFCAVFLVMLCIAYIYYRNKPTYRMARDQEERLTK